MKYSTRLSDAAHLLLFIYLNPKDDLSSAAIAESIQTNPAYIRQLMSALKKAGLLNGTRGMATPTLNHSPAEISLLDIYRAVEGDKALLHQDTHTNPDCGVGVNIQLVLRDCFDQVQRAAEAEMHSITLQNILDHYHERLSLLGKNLF